MRFKPNPRAAALLAQDRRLQAHVLAVADDAAQDVRNRAPARVKAPRNARFYARQIKDGAEVVAKSPIWHWPEFGARNFPPQPYIRPAVQRALTKAGGKFKAQ